MKLTYWLSSAVFFMYFSVVVLVTVNGQPSKTEEDKDAMIVELREELAKVLVRVGKLEDQATSAADKCETQQDGRELNSFIDV